MVRALLVCLLFLLLHVSPGHALPAPPELETLCWVAYAPTNFNPNLGINPSAASLQADLELLHSVGINGLVTYGADGVLGTLVPGIAEDAGFEAMIMGLWDPASNGEYNNAVAAASTPIVVGYVVGNEGLYVRYSLETLLDTMSRLRQATGKPVTTSEEWGDYWIYDDLWTIGDWIYPNVHPYWGGIYDPVEAALWTRDRYDQFDALTDLPVNFKEVGMPTDGDAGNLMSEVVQAESYRVLEMTTARFTNFEAFDQDWKGTGVEPHWGLFESDRTPKAVLADGVCPPPATVAFGFTFQGRPAAPSPRLQVPVHLTIREQGTNIPIFDRQVTTDQNGVVTLSGLTGGAFRYTVKGAHTLSRVLTQSQPAGSSTIAFPELREGDANDNNVVNISDFSILAVSFSLGVGQAGYDGRADFNGDDVVNISDFSLLAQNFGMAGEA
ncbi:MAG: hypothetical protein IPK19_27455 [Chloroflexi bacterium]|nr:hypothetical protein [Chloroflexota bacterium]